MKDKDTVLMLNAVSLYCRLPFAKKLIQIIINNYIHIVTTRLETLFFFFYSIIL